MARGIDRFDAPTFGIDQGEEIRTKLADGQVAEVDTELAHLVHAGVPPSTLFEVAMAVGRAHPDPPA